MTQMMRTVCCWVLVWLGVTCIMTSSQQCDITSPRYAQLQTNSTSHDNAFHLGALLAVHEAGLDPLTCGKTLEEGIQHLEAFLWALKNYKNRYPNILSGLNVGGLVFDTCSRTDRATQQILNLAGCSVNYGNPQTDPSNVFGFVGPSTDEETREVAPLLGDLHRTLIGFNAAHDDFSNSTMYPYYLRTSPAAADEIKALVAIIKDQGWWYVQVLFSDDDYGLTALDTFNNLAAAEGICVVFHREISASGSDQDMENTIEDLLENKDTRIVVLLSGKDAVRNLLAAAQRYYTMRGSFTWIGTSEWGEDPTIVQSVAEVAEGAITVALDSQNSIPLAFQQHYDSLEPTDSQSNPWLREFWQDKFQCKFTGDGTREYEYTQECDVTNQKLDSAAIGPSVGFTIKAVNVLLNAIDMTWKAKCKGSQNTLCSGFLSTVGELAQLRDNVFEVTDPGEFGFNEGSGDTVVIRYKVLNFRSAHGNCANHCYAKVGYFEKFEERLLLQEPFFFYDEQGQRLRDPEIPSSVCSPVPCVQCGDLTTPAPSTTASTSAKPPTADPRTLHPFSELRRDTWVIALLVLAGLGVLLVLGFEIYLMSKIIGTPFVKHWRTMWLGQLLLLAVLLCYLTLFAFVPTPTVATCTIIRFGVGSTYSMCFAVLLVKLMIILSSKNIGYLKGIYQVLMFVFAWGVQLVLDAEWLILDPPGVHRVNSSSGEISWICDVTFKEHIISLVYVMFLILITTLIAIRTHGIITNHREGIFIGLSAGFTIPCWVVWILLGILNTDKGWEDPCMAFGLFFTATLILFTLFLPKVRQLNSMGVEGIYAEDDSPDGYAASIIAPSAVPGSVVAGSVILGPPSYKSKMNGSLVYVNGGLYTDPATNPKPVHLHYNGDPNALYLRHPSATTNTAPPSVRSAPPMYASLRPAGSDVIHTNTRVLRMTGDLTGRPPSERQVQSEFNYNVQYGTTKSNRSGRGPSSRAGTLTSKKQSRSLTDLGAL